MATALALMSRSKHHGKLSLALEEMLALLALRTEVRLPRSQKTNSSAQNIVLRALLGNSHGAPRQRDGIGISL
jgi:hypothetical protein